jgi:hypothetical protein
MTTPLRKGAEGLLRHAALVIDGHEVIRVSDLRRLLDGAAEEERTFTERLEQRIRNRRLPSASQLQRAAACPASESLPHADSPTKDGMLGTKRHDFLKRADEVGRDAALAEVDDDVLDFCKKIPIDKLPKGGERELRLFWDYATDEARALAHGVHRDYSSQRPTEFVGTADYVGRDGDRVVVLDWKTGHRYLGPARDSWQLRMLALAAARVTGASEADVAYFFLREEGEVIPAWAHFNAFDLADIADELRALAARLRDAEQYMSSTTPGRMELSVLREGEHCDYCPAWMACPAKVALARAIGNGEAVAELDDLDKQVEQLTAAQLGAVVLKAERVIDLAERVKAKARERAAMADVPLGDGRVLGTQLRKYTIVKDDIAYQVIRERYGAEAADKAAPRSLTLKAINAFGKDTAEEIERRGGIIVGKKSEVRVHRKKETA